MHFTNVTTKTTAVAIVAMALSHFALIRVAAAPVAYYQADSLSNSQDPKKPNVNVEDPCKAGEKTCIADNVATCSPENDWEVTTCPTNMPCFAFPLNNGTVVSCITKEDALALIENAGAKNGTNGDDPSKNHDNHNGEDVSSTTVATTTTDAVETGLSTVTSTPAASDIPEISIPLGDTFSDKLSTTTDAAAATSTSSGAEVTDIASSTTYSTATVTDAPLYSLTTSDSADTMSASTDTSAASGGFTTRLTTTVVVTATECSTTDASESSKAQDATTTPNLVTFTTHPFSPIPVSTSTASVIDVTSTTDGYVTASTSSAAATLVTPTETQASGTILPVESSLSSTTGAAPTYYPSSEPSIPPKQAAPTPAFNVLPPHFTPA